MSGEVRGRPVRAKKQCARDGCDARVVGRTYCPQHDVKPLSPSARDAKSRGEAARRKAAVAAYVRVNGWVCPGWMRDPHPSTDLTAAHTVAVAHGGGSSPLLVLCRSCNSRQGTAPLS